MKRTKKILVGLLATLSVLSGSLGLAACGGNDSSSNKGEATEIEKVYAQYVIYAQAEGQTPLSYEEWLATIKGEKGEQGIQGEKGDTGAQGEKGDKGEKGDTGAQGEKGEQGIQGEQGEKGDTGADGVGIKNAYINEDGELIVELTVGEPINLGKVVGKDGEQGEQGIQGEKGEKGDTGAQGEKGEKGDKGDTGATGADGVGIKNAYINEDGELIVELTVGEPINLGKVVGKDGEQGEQGIQGEKGDKGDKGDQGEKGDKGDTGATGAQGADGVGIEKVEYDENGDLLVTFADGTTQTVKAPEQHVHTFGEWTNYSAPGDGNQILFRVCLTCSEIEWKLGSHTEHNWTIVTTSPTCQADGFDTKTCTICGKVETENPTEKIDHAWATEYSHDNSYHWFGCATCDEVKDKQEHSVLSSGECSVCNELVGATEGIVYDVSNGEAQVVMYEGTATRVRVADTYQGAPVTKIGNEAFKDTTITSIVIPDSVTSIGNYAFYRCSKLTSIVIPNSVTSIGYYAFYSCYSLTSITIPDSVTSIGNYAFSYCESLTSVTIGDSVTFIGEYAFYSCYSLTSVVIGDGVKSIGDYMFKDCNSLTSVEIPDSVTSIGDYAFSGCNNLQFNEYGNAKYLGGKTNDYFALIETKSKNFSSYTIHNDTKIIADYAFYDCSSLTSIVIPDSVTSIGYRAFSGCDRLTSIEIPDSVTSIGDYAFAYCSSLTSVTFEDTSTWYRTYNYTDWQNKTGGTQRDVSNPSDNASYFVNNYTSYWYKL